MADYQPIPCIQHERLEFAALRRIPLQMTYFDNDGGVHMSSRILVTDVGTHNKAEWLSFISETGEDKILRLDRIIAFQELTLSD